MSTNEEDFKFVYDLSRAFFKKTHIKKTISLIKLESLTGWEKWVQIEFSAHILEHEGIKAWDREYRYKLDQRVRSLRQNCAVDFVVHQKGKHTHMAIELKVKKTPNSCIRGMARDHNKIAAITKKENDIRSAWCLGIHLSEHEDTVFERVKKHMGDPNIWMDKALFRSETIGKTGYSFTVF